MARYWLGPWVWNGAWDMPAGAIAALDLRSIPQCAQTVTPAGLALFITPDAANLGSSYENLGTNPLANWNQQAKNRWRSALSLPNTLTANNLRQAAWETLTLQSDPIGDDRCLPLIPSTARRFEVWLAGQLADSKQFDLGGFESPPMLDLLKRIYRRMRQACLDGQMPATHYRKWLGFQVRKYGIDYRNFQPADVPDEEPLPPETTITENFNTADSDTLGPNLTWTEVLGDWDVVSNKASALSPLDTGNLSARAESDLSGDDHYSQAVVTSGSFGNDLVGLTVRFAAAAATYYAAWPYDNSNLYFVSKIVTGTRTNLASQSHSPSYPDTYKGQADGSTIAGHHGGSAVVSVTDTSITGNTRCGLFAQRATGSTAPTHDDFEAADLGGGGATVPIFRRHYQLMQTR